jgi:hypothetical protein
VEFASLLLASSIALLLLLLRDRHKTTQLEWGEGGFILEYVRDARGDMVEEGKGAQFVFATHARARFDLRVLFIE